MAEWLVIDLEIGEALQTEIKEALEHKNQSYVDWCDLLDKGEKKNKVKLTITHDMGWQKRSYGRIYESSSRHAFIIGGRSMGIIGKFLYSKAYQKCDAAGKRGEETEGR